MRVGIIVYALDRPLGGISRYTIELVKALAHLDKKLELVLLVAGTSAGPLAQNDIPLLNVELPGCRLLPGLITLGNVVIPRLAHKYNLDIVHDPTGVTPLAFGASKAKRIVTIHDAIPWSFPGVSTRLDSWIYHYWLPRVLPYVDKVITVSAYSKSGIVQYLRMPSSKVDVVYNAADRRFKPTPLKASIKERYNLPTEYILYVGSVEERKNLRRVLQAYALLRKKSIPQRLVIGGPKLRKYEQIIQTLHELHLEDDVIFTDYIAEEDLPALYTGADLFVYPSLSEGFGLPVLEAMSCGTPVITSNCSSLPEVAGDTAVLVDPYNVEEIADAMNMVLTNRASYQTMSEKARQRAEQFTWERAAQETMSIYESVLSS